MPRWFLSYHSPDQALAERLKAAIERKDSGLARVLRAEESSPRRLLVGELAHDIDEATAFILLVGAKGLGPWQVLEYYEALDRRVKTSRRFPAGPGVARRADRARIAISAPVALDRHRRSGFGEGRRAHIRRGRRRRLAAGELWRHTAPYRGLAAIRKTTAIISSAATVKTAEVI